MVVVSPVQRLGNQMIPAFERVTQRVEKHSLLKPIPKRILYLVKLQWGFKHTLFNLLFWILTNKTIQELRTEEDQISTKQFLHRNTAGKPQCSSQASAESYWAWGMIGLEMQLSK